MAWVGNEEGPVVADEDVLDLLCGLLVIILPIKGDQGLGNALSDGIDLGGVTTAVDANAHVNAIEAVSTEEEDGLVGLVLQDLRLHQFDWASVAMVFMVSF